MFGKPAEDMLRALRRLQDGLGAQQDAYMAQNHLATLAADPASGLPPATLFLMGRLAEHHARVTAQVRETLARSWRKVRGKRWRALRARLGELRANAEATNGAGDAAHAVTPDEHSPADTNLATQAPGSESRPVKH